MSDVYFSTNPSDYAKLEGLYIAERKPAAFIRGGDVNTIGLATQCVRGPLVPTPVTSPGEFLSIFGGRDQTAAGDSSTLVGHGWEALLNKPFGETVIRRVAASDAVKGTKTMSDVTPTAIVRFDASSVGAWALNVTVAIEAATDADATHFNARVAYHGGEVVYQNLSCSGTDDNLALIIGTDSARLVDAVKLANGRPLNSGAAALTAATDGTIAATDYITGIQELAVFPGINVALVPEAVPSGSGGVAAYHSALVTLAASAVDRIFLTWSQAHGQSRATEITQLGTQITTRSDRLWWCYNSAYTYDPVTGNEIQTAPHVWLASILSQIDVDVHPGAKETLPYLAGISRLTNLTLNRADLVALKAAGICTLERNTDGPQFRSVVGTDLTAGKTEGTRRRMTDYLQLSASATLRGFVKGKNTPVVRANMAGALTGFSDTLRRAERVIEDYSIDTISVNTPAQRAQGEEHLLWEVRLIGHILALVFETDISTGTVIER